MSEAQDDVPVYVVGNFVIDDAETYRKYELGFFPQLKKHGGEFITYDDNVITLEGDPGIKGRMVLMKFKNEQTALDWYNDPGYQELIGFRRESTKLNFLAIQHGMPSRAPQSE